MLLMSLTTTPQKKVFFQFKDLISTLRERYPERDFPKDEVLEHINPCNNENIRHLATYILYDDQDHPIGGLIGEDDQFSLKGKWLIMDPTYQDGKLVRKLFETVKEDFDDVTLLAQTFAGKKDLPPDRYASRQQALVEYYKRLGFKVNSDDETYQYSHLPGAPIPMIWKKISHE